MRVRALFVLLLLGTGCQAEIGPVSDAGTSPPPPPPPPSTPFVAQEVEVRRLSNTEIDQVLEDILLDNEAPAQRLLGEDEYRPYDNDYTVQESSSAFVDSLEILARDVAERFVADGARKDRVLGCVPAAPDDRLCLVDFTKRFGRLALRRPILDAEAEAMADAFLPFATEDNQFVDNGFDTAVALVVQAFMLDPEFLYRIEAGTLTEDQGVYRLNGLEIATRLSFLLWGSSPDEALLDLAASGGLATGAGRVAAAQRLLEDPRARRQVQRFHSLWLGYRTVPHGPELTAAFSTETGALLDRVIFEDQSDYLTVFTATETYANDFLADHYGLQRPAGGEGWVSYGNTERAGILSHGSVLAAFSKFSDTSPTQRGIFVRTRLMCDDLPPPPPTVDVDQPPDGEAACKIDRYKEHMATGSCRDCHQGMDPVGFGLERYDVAGRYRTHDDGNPACDIDDEGALPGYGSFRGPKELATKLLEAGEIQDCVVRQVVAYAQGRSIRRAELGLINSLKDSFAASGNRYDQLLLALVEHDAFALRLEATP